MSLTQFFDVPGISWADTRSNSQTKIIGVTCRNNTYAV